MKHVGRLPEDSELSEHAVWLYAGSLWWLRTFASFQANQLIGTSLEKTALAILEEHQDCEVLA